MEPADLSRQLNDALAHIHLAVKMAADELPAAQLPLLHEIGQLADSIAQECQQTPTLSPTARSSGNESPHLDEHLQDMGALTGGGYREGDYSNAPEFREVADLHEAPDLAEKGIAADAYSKGLYIEEATDSGDEDYVDALRQAAGQANNPAAGPIGEDRDALANVMGQPPADRPLTDADLAPSAAERQRTAQDQQRLARLAQARPNASAAVANLLDGVEELLDVQQRGCAQSREIDLQVEQLLTKMGDLLPQLH